MTANARTGEVHFTADAVQLKEDKMSQVRKRRSVDNEASDSDAEVFIAQMTEKGDFTFIFYLPFCSTQYN